MKLIKKERPFLTSEELLKVLTAATIMTIALYAIAMVFSLLGSKYFILNYQNTQMDKIESFLQEHKIMALVSWIFTTLEFAIVLAFTLQRIPKWYYVLTFYAIAMFVAAFIHAPTIFYQMYPFVFYLTVPLIEQLLDSKKISIKKYGFQLLRLLIAIIITYIFQVMIYTIKSGTLSFTDNHVQNLSAAFIYAIEYDIALLVVFSTISLYINREKGGSKSWTTSHNPGGSSQTTKNASQISSRMKTLTKTQRTKLRLLYVKLYLTQLGGFLLLMVLPFLLGKVFEFLVMYFSFAITRSILGFKYSLHFKKESTCITVGILVFGILSLAVPFFTILVILAITLGIALAILLHLSYIYKGMWLFNLAAKPDKFALLYVYFEGNLTEPYVKKMCKYRQLDPFQTGLIVDFTQANKISYLAHKYNYSQRMIIYKLDEAISKLTA